MKNRKLALSLVEGDAEAAGKEYWKTEVKDIEKALAQAKKANDAYTSGKLEKALTHAKDMVKKAK